MASSVTLKFGNRTVEYDLIEGRVHIPTLGHAFTLQVVKLNGKLVSFNREGFTHVKFSPGDVLDISGTPAVVAAMPGTPYVWGPGACKCTCQLGVSVVLPFHPCSRSSS